MILILTIAIGTWLYLVNITEGAISQRYGLYQNNEDENFKLDLSGRFEIYSIDIKIFKDNLISGVGPGQANRLRYVYERMGGGWENFDESAEPEYNEYGEEV